MRTLATYDRLRAIWELVLDTRDLTPDDDFFYLGGDSLSGLEVIERIHAGFGVDVPPMAMYDRVNTLAKMTALIDAELSRSQEGS